MPRTNGQRHPLVLVRYFLQRLGVRRQGAVGTADADSPGMRRAHHHAFQHRLAADQSSFLAALQRRQELEGSQKPKMAEQ